MSANFSIVKPRDAPVSQIYFIL